MMVQVGLCHRTAPRELLEHLHGRVRTAARLGDGRVVAVTTCHRLELYLEDASELQALSAWCRWTGLSADEPVPEGLQVREGACAGRHLLRVAAGLESAVLGEDQVLAQLRAAYRDACRRATAGPLLHRLFHAAFRAGRRVRAETELASGSRSLSAAAVNHLGHRFGSLSDRRVLVLGCGTMGALAARRLAERQTGELLLSNRTWQKAATLAASTGGRPVPWQWRTRVLEHCDAVISAASGPEIVSAPEICHAVEAGRLQVALDLGMPRNMSVTEPKPRGLEFLDLADLAARLDEERSARSAAVQAAEAIVDEELAAWWEWTVARDKRRRHQVEGVAAG